MQHKIITDYICDILNRYEYDYDNIMGVNNMVVDNINRLNEGEDIAVIITDGKCVGLKKLADFSDTFTIKETDIVITYQTLERLYNDKFQNAF